jgi:O-antigen/teichoic acid export membrane protein
VVNLIAAALQLCLVGVLALSGQLTPATALAATAAGFLAVGGLMAWSLARVHGFHVLSPRVRGTLTPKLLRTGLTYHPASVAVQFSPRFDLLIVGAFVSTAQAGTYSLALTLADAMFFAAQSLTLAALPRQLKGDLQDSIRFTLQFARQSLLLTLSIALIASVFAYPFVTLVYGPDFESAVLPLVILLFAGASFALEAPSRILLIRIASPALVSSIVSAGVAVNVILTVALTHAIGIAGAALASLISFWLLALALLAVVRKRTGQSLRPLVARPSNTDEVLILPIAALRRALALGFRR